MLTAQFFHLFLVALTLSSGKFTAQMAVDTRQGLVRPGARGGGASPHHAQKMGGGPRGDLWPQQKSAYQGGGGEHLGAQTHKGRD